MKNFYYYLYQPYKWFVFMPYLILSTCFFGSMAVLLAFLTTPKIASFVGGALWARLIGYMTPIFVSVSGRENIDKKQSYVIVSNHQSQYDIFALYGWLGIDFKWVMKMELRKIPFIGIGCEKVGHIFIDRSNRKAAISSLEAAKKKIVTGTSVIFFPEGTRSRNGEVMDFKKGAFKMAFDLNLPILPVSITGTRSILPPKTINLMPGKVYMKIHEPIDISGYNDENIEELIKKTRDTIITGLKAC